MIQFKGVEITEDHKREWREANAQANAAIARLNALYVVTGRPFRQRLEKYMLPAPVADDCEPNAEPNMDDIDNMADIDNIDAPRPARRERG